MNRLVVNRIELVGRLVSIFLGGYVLIKMQSNFWVVAANFLVISKHLNRQSLQRILFSLFSFLEQQNVDAVLLLLIIILGISFCCLFSSHNIRLFSLFVHSCPIPDPSTGPLSSSSSCSSCSSSSTGDALLYTHVYIYI